MNIGSAGLFQATVLGNVKGQAILLVGGKTLSVPDSDLKGGDVIQARLGQDGKSLEDVSSLRRGAPASQIGRYLEGAGIPRTEANFLAAYKAMQMGLTLKPELFEQVSRFLPLLGGLSETSIHSLLLAFELKLPLGAPVLNLLKRFLQKGMGFRELLQSEVSGKAVNSWLGAYLERLDEDGLDLRRLLRRLGLWQEAATGQGQVQDSVFEDGALPKEFLSRFKELMSLYRLMAEAQDVPWVLVLPYQMDQEYRELTLRYQKAADEAGGSRLELFLEMSALGELAFDFYLTPETLGLKILSHRDEVVRFLEENSVELQEALGEAAGGRSVGLRVLLGIAHAPQESLFSNRSVVGGVNVEV